MSHSPDGSPPSSPKGDRLIEYTLDTPVTPRTE